MSMLKVVEANTEQTSDSGLAAERSLSIKRLKGSNIAWLFFILSSIKMHPKTFSKNENIINPIWQTHSFLGASLTGEKNKSRTLDLLSHGFWLDHWVHQKLSVSIDVGSLVVCVVDCRQSRRHRRSKSRRHRRRKSPSGSWRCDKRNLAKNII